MEQVTTLDGLPSPEASPGSAQKQKLHKGYAIGQKVQFIDTPPKAPQALRTYTPERPTHTEDVHDEGASSPQRSIIEFVDDLRQSFPKNDDEGLAKMGQSISTTRENDNGDGGDGILMVNFGGTVESAEGMYMSMRRKWVEVNEFGMAKDHYVRSRLIAFVGNIAFDAAIYLLIFFNCVAMAMWNPMEEESTSLIVLEWGFQIAFTIESLVKCIAMGVWRSDSSYFRDKWNIMDFLVVVLGWAAAAAGGGGGVSALRVVRVLRPLRAIKGIPMLHIIIGGITRALPELMAVSALCCFIFLMFGIFALQLFTGKFQQRCYDPFTETFDFASERLCSKSPKYGRQCDEGWTCEDSGVNPNYDITSFDNIVYGVLTIFQCITLEGWADIMYWTEETCGKLTNLYFVLLIFLGSFFLVNMIVAVIFVNMYQYTEQQDAGAIADDDSSSDNSNSDIDSGDGDDDGHDDSPGSEKKEGAARENLPCPTKNISRESISLTMSGIECEISDDLAVPRRLVQSGASSEAIEANSLTPPEYALSEAEANTVQHLVSRAATLVRDRRFREAASNLSRSVSLIVSAPPALTVDEDCKYGESRGDIGADESAHTQGGDGDDADEPTMDDKPLAWACYKLANSPWFERLFIAIIILNMGMLSAEHYGQPDWLARFFAQGNTVVTVLFTLEVAVKLKGLGWDGFRADAFNKFDLVVVAASLVEMLFSSESSGGVNSMRSIRLVRVFKLARTWKTLTRLLKNMALTLDASGPFLGILLLFVFVSSLIGMQLFGGSFPMETDENGQVWSSRSNYDTIGWSMLTTFQLISGENWNEVMYIAMDSTQQRLSALYFVSVIIFGIYIVLNIFLAIIIKNYARSTSNHRDDYSGSEDESDIFGEPNDSGDIEEGHKKSPLDEDGEDDGQSRHARRGHGEVKLLCGRVVENEALKFNALHILPADSAPRRGLASIVLHPLFDKIILVLIMVNCAVLAIDEPGEGGVGPSEKVQGLVDFASVFFSIVFTVEAVVKVMVLGFIRHPGSYMRSYWNVLDGVIVTAGLIDLFGTGDVPVFNAMRVVRALRPLRALKRLPGLRIVIESILKSIPPCASIASVLLLFYLVFSILGCNLFGGRFYSCNDSSRTCYPFAPNMDSTQCPDAIACVGVFFDPNLNATVSREWRNPQFKSSGAAYSFDSVKSTMLALFEVASLEMWLDIMYTGIDATEIGWAPQRNNDARSALFFVLFICIIDFFIQELFVAVIIDNFNEIKCAKNGSVLMTKEQVRWRLAQAKLMKRKPLLEGDAVKVPEQPWRKELLKLVASRGFEMFITVLIGANICFMATEHANMGEGYSKFLDVVNYFFTFAFLIEAVMKLVAMEWIYFKSKWNRFDFFIVLTSLVSFFMQASGASMGSVNITIFRVFRVARLVRLLRVSPGVQAILHTLYLSLPALCNVGSLLLLVFFVFAVAGMQMFGHVPRGEWINDHANFETFTSSMLLLFRCSTGEAWNALMRECAVHSAAATPYFVTFILMASYIMVNLFVAIILENFESQCGRVTGREGVSKADLKCFSRTWGSLKEVSVGGSLKDFAEAMDAKRRLMKFTDLESALAWENEIIGQMQHIRGANVAAASFRGEILFMLPDRSEWNKKEGKLRRVLSMETKAGKMITREEDRMYLPAAYLVALLKRLPHPLGLRSDRKTAADMMRRVRQCDIPMDKNGYVHYSDVLQGIVRSAFHKSDDVTITHSLDDIHFYAHEWFACVQMQAAWRGLREKRKRKSVKVMSRSHKK